MILFLLVAETVTPTNAADPKKSAKEAIERYSSATKKNPNDVVAWNGLSTALIFLGKTSEGLAAFQKAIQLNPKNASLLSNMGKALLDSGQLDEAITALHQAIEINPESAAAWANLGGCLLKQGKMKEAFEATHKATGLGPADATAWNNHGAVLLYLEKLDESVEASQRAIKLDPKNALSWANLGAALLKQGKVDESITASEKATQLNPQESIAWNNLAGALLEQGKTAEAVITIKKALDINPADAEAWSNLGVILLKQGKAEEGINAIRKACEVNPLHVNSWIKLGETLLIRAEYEGAIKASRKAIELDPKNIAALGILIKANGQLKHPDRVGTLMARWLLVQSSAAKTNNDKPLILEMAKGLKVLQVEVPLETPSPSAIQDYYKKHKDRYNNDQVHLKMISAPMVTKTMQAMETLRKQLANGGDFTALAKEHSDDSAATNGGDRGWMKRSDLRKGLADIIFSLKVGIISPVLEDLDHYRILTVIERKTGAPTPLVEVKERIIFQLKAAAMEQKIQQWIVDARKELNEAQSRL